MEDLDPNIVKKTKELVDKYLKEFSNTKDLDDYYDLFFSNLLFLEIIKKHYDHVHSMNEFENCREDMEEMSSSISGEFFSKMEKEIFKN